MLRKFKMLFSGESGSGILLLLAALLALIFENLGFLTHLYDNFIHLQITIGVGSLKLDEPLHFWVNDALMAIFFFSVGLELKREMIEGQLRHISQVLLPTFAALGGVVLPAIIFYLFNHNDPFAIRGWAIPTATDIAFAVGVLALLGRRIPISLKLFILTLAIMDDLAAIVIIALFYSTTLNFVFLGLAALGLFVLSMMNKFGVEKKLFFVIIIILVWIFVLHSGIHASIAGVATAFTIPLHTKSGGSMTREFENLLGNFVSYIILPLFAFVNAGVSLKGMNLEYLFGPVPLGIICALFFGKQIGIFLFSYIAIKFKFAYMPEKATWLQLYAVAIICGIGFTMSLFVNALAYNNSDVFHHTDKLAILIGSLISGFVGYFVAKFASRKKDEELKTSKV